jgi:hypothetical protein
MRYLGRNRFNIPPGDIGDDPDKEEIEFPDQVSAFASGVRFVEVLDGNDDSFETYEFIDNEYVLIDSAIEPVRI